MSRFSARQILDRVPDELRQHPQWVDWRYEERGGKATKVPVDPRTLGRADTTDAATWAAFPEAVAVAGRRGLAGVGFVFSRDDPFAGVDLDDCRDPATGTIADWAQDIIAALDSYSEVSPSGTGVKIFVRGTLPPKGRRRGPIEMYDRARFFTVTGRHLAGTPPTVEGRHAALAALHARLFARPAPARPRGTPVDPGRDAVDPDDARLLARAKGARNGARFEDLWAGEATAYGSASEADAALCAMLAFWTGPDPARIDRLFRRSARYREKWEREDYRRATIDLALQRSEYYRGRRERRAVRQGRVRIG